MITKHRIPGIITAFLTGLGLLLMAASAAAQGESKKAEVKKIEVRVKVSGADGEQIPARTKVRISGRDEACGALRQQDAEALTDQSGVAVFSAVPVCKVTVRVAPDGFIPAREEHNLADYDASSGITLKPKKER